MRSVAIGLLLACSVVGCRNEAPDRCARGVRHVVELTVAQGGPGGPPSAEERRAIDVVIEQSIAACRKEGLTPEQLDCVRAATDWDAFRQLGQCPAIRDRRPSWLIIP